jgi:predicted permease
MTFLSESLLLSLAGGVAGLLLAWYGVRALVLAGPAQLPRLQEITIDWRVFAFGTAISVLAGILFGVLPLPQHMRRPLQGIVRGSRGETAGIDRQRVRKTLIVLQIALALVMVTGSGLMLRSFQKLRSVEIGVQPEGVLTVAISTGAQVSKPAAASLYQRMIDEIDALPGTSHVGATNALPLDPGGVNGGSFNIRGVELAKDGMEPFAFFSAVSEAYFEAIGTRLIRGRALDRSDQEQGRNVIVISEALSKLLPGEPLGQHIKDGADTTWMEVVGIVQDVRTFDLREDSRPMGYLPMQNPFRGVRISAMNLVVRTSGNPLDLVDPVRAAIRRVDPGVPIISARTMQRVVDESMAETSFTMTIMLIAAVLAMLLGAIGIYGVVGYVVSQRTAEISIRIALGAYSDQVERMIMRQALVLASLGVGIGLLGAFAVSRFLDAILFQVDSRDPLTFALVALVMFVVSGVAAWLPARRAARVSPLQALSAE